MSKEKIEEIPEFDFSDVDREIEEELEYEEYNENMERARLEFNEKIHSYLTKFGDKYKIDPWQLLFEQSLLRMFLSENWGYTGLVHEFAHNLSMAEELYSQLNSPKTN